MRTARFLLSGLVVLALTLSGCLESSSSTGPDQPGPGDGGQTDLRPDLPSEDVLGDLPADPPAKDVEDVTIPTELPAELPPVEDVDIVDIVDIVDVGDVGDVENPPDIVEDTPPDAPIPDGPYEGYTLFSPNGSRITYLIDMDGEVVHTWNSDCAMIATTPYLLEDGTILRACQVDRPSMRAGGSGGRIQRLAWNGHVIWDYEYSGQDYLQHHDIQPMPGGNVLLIAWERKTAAEAVQAGRESSLEMWPLHIVEVEPNGFDGGDIVWRWHAWDHLIQENDRTKDNHGVVEDHPELLDVNLGSMRRGGDWIHANAIDYNEELDQIVFSSHMLHEYYIIDHSTTIEEAASHEGGRWGRGGDFLYRWGNPQNYGAGRSDDQHFFVIHGVNWIDEGSPGAEHILIFNNGDRPGNQDDYSVVEELVTPLDEDGLYFLEPGAAFGPEGPIWTYSDPGEFYSNHLAGAFRLPNGNTLVIEATNAHLFEVNPGGDVVWSYVHQGGGRTQIARAQRYGVDHPGLADLR